MRLCDQVNRAGLQWVDRIDEVMAVQGLTGTVVAIGQDLRDDLVGCETGESITGRPAVDIAWSAGLRAPDGSFTVAVGTNGDMAEALRTDRSLGASMGFLTPGTESSQLVVDSHEDTLQTGRPDSSGQIVEAPADDVLVTDEGVIFNVADADAQIAAYLVRTFNSPLPGDDRSCDTHLGAPFPSEFAPAETAGPDAVQTCVPSSTVLCLNNDRFRTEVTFDAGPVAASRVEIDASASLHSLGDAQGTHVLMRVVNACEFNSNYWVFHAASSDAPIGATVTDTRSGDIWSLDGAIRAQQAWYLQALPCE